MSTPIYYQLDSLSVIDIVGRDADKILNNLTTNDVVSLAAGEGCESFITDVRGKTLGHVVVFRDDASLRLIGASGQSESLAAHADRYTIREDAEPRILDAEYVSFVIPTESVSAAEIIIAPPTDSARLGSAVINFDQTRATAYQTDWLGEGTRLILVSTADGSVVEQALQNKGLSARDQAAFHRQRTLYGFPWYGVDFDSSNLPQEADRNAAAISFTKGCYLGQETVARLDALGQVQKKLVKWSLEGSCPQPGAILTVNEKTVGRLTSAAQNDAGGVVAIGMTRRSHFEAPATAEYVDPSSGETFVATVH